jgi:hypothetical protein
MPILPRETAAHQPPTTRAAGTCEGGGRSASADRLNDDEWQFLRATPDYDAEEMASVVLPPMAGVPDREQDGGGGPALLSSEPFPEAGSLVSMLDDLLDQPPRAESGLPAATWSEVPAAEEWADLMAPQGGKGAPARPAAPPPAHDVLRDALAAGARLRIFEDRDR